MRKSIYFLAVILLSLILSFLCGLELFKGLEFFTLDYFLKSGSEIEADNKIVFVVMDEESEKRFCEKEGLKDKYQWRSYHSRIIKKIVDSGAKRIGFDMTFEKETPYDKFFASAIKDAQNKGVNVVIGTSYDPVNNSFSKTSPEILGADPLIGIIDVLQYTDRYVVRGIELQHREDYTDPIVKGFRLLPSFVLQMFGEKNLEAERVPIDKDGVMLINFTRKPFRTFSYAKAYEALSDEAIDYSGNKISEPFKDKYVFVFSCIQEGSRDSYPTPLEETMFGGEIHGQALNTILRKDYIRTLSWSEKAILLVGINIIFALFLMSRLKQKCILVFISVICLAYLTYLVFKVKPHYFIPTSDILIGIILTGLFFKIYQDLESQRIIASYLGLPVKSYKILMERFGKEKEFRQTVTILYSDIRSYTEFTANNSPDVVMSLMTEYYAVVGKIITNYRGYIYSCMGDAFVAIFGFPLKDKEKGRNREERALLSAYEMSKGIPILLSKWREAEKGVKDVPQGFGVGITTGEVTISNIATGQRVQMSIVGDPINLSARLETATKEIKITKCLALLSEEAFKNSRSLISEYREFVTEQKKDTEKVSVNEKEKTLVLQGISVGIKVYAVDELYRE
ncbi:MAG: adenylate/guanylate cyclase domain-containing protein [bacterium]